MNLVLVNSLWCYKVLFEICRLYLRLDNEFFNKIIFIFYIV